MSCVLKRDPAWLKSLPINSTLDALADLMGESGHVSVPATLLLAASPLLRSMMTDILHPGYSPLVILLPGVEGDVLQVLLELLLKGTSEINEDMQMKIRQLFDILNIGDSCSLQTEFIKNMEYYEDDDLEYDHQDSKVKLEIQVKVEQDEECQGIVIMNSLEIQVKVEQDEECQDINMNSEIGREGTTVNMTKEERISDIVLKGLGEDKQPPARHSDSLLNLDDWESRAGQSKEKEVIDSQKMMRQRKTNLHKEKVKVFNCQECEYQCHFKSGIEKHMRKHTGEKPFKCCLCEYKTGENSNLLRHTMRHHEKVKNYNCDNCEFKTAIKLDLITHQRMIHSKPFSCDKCAFKTGCQTNLTRHQITHSEAKPFNCDRCDFKANRKDNLVSHMKIHGGEKLCEGSKV